MSRLLINTPKFSILQGKYKYVTIISTGFNRQFSLKKGYIVPTTKNINGSILIFMIDDAFPCLRFNEYDNPENMDICNYIHETGGRWLLDLVAMSKSNNRNLSKLFHSEFTAQWNEKKARKKYDGKADVIRFFIDMENEIFLNEFHKLKFSNLLNIDKIAVFEMFFNVSGYYNGKTIWEDWDYSKLLVHKPSDIYKAFERYAHKQYTLMGLGLRKHRRNTDALKTFTLTNLILAGKKLLDDIILKKIQKIKTFGIDRQIAFFELEQEVLESIPTGGSIYIPTELKVFLKQLRSRMPSFLNQKKHDNPEQVNKIDLFNSSERKTIKKHIQKIGAYLDEDEDLLQYRNLQITGTYREKVKFIHRMICKNSIHKHYSQRDLELFYELFYKLKLPLSLNMQIKNPKTGEVYQYSDTIKDPSNVLPEDYLSWTEFFMRVFKSQLNETQLKTFLACIQKHFNEYLPEFDSGNNIKISYYSKKILFSEFCSSAEIEEDKELWEPYLEKINRVIQNINMARNEIRRIS